MRCRARIVLLTFCAILAFALAVSADPAVRAWPTGKAPAGEKALWSIDEGSLGLTGQAPSVYEVLKSLAQGE